MEREELNFFMQKSPAQNISNLCRAIRERASVEQIQKPTPQTLLVPVRDPINGGTFLGGEVLVTSAITQVNDNNGWAMVMDDNPQLAADLAIIDGAFAGGICTDEIIHIAKQGQQAYEEEKARVNAQIAETRVAFDLL